jgi:hypothetical protein
MASSCAFKSLDVLLMVVSTVEGFEGDGGGEEVVIAGLDMGSGLEFSSHLCFFFLSLLGPEDELESLSLDSHLLSWLLPYFLLLKGCFGVEYCTGV